MTRSDTADRGASDGAPDRAPIIAAERLPRRFGPALELLVNRPSGPAERAPVLLVHGAFAAAWCWEESWLPRIGATGRHVAAVSLRGHGASEGRDELAIAGLADFLADLTLAIEAMPSPPVVVAHSFGGLLAQLLLGHVAAGAPALRGLVLLSSLPPEGLALIAPWLGMSTLIAAATGTVDVRRATAFGDRYRRSGDGTWNAVMAATHAACAGDAAFTGLTQALLPLPILPAWLARLPTLVLHGGEDPLIDAATAARTAVYHRADYECLPQCGHFPMLGRHAAAGSDAVCRWLVNKGI